MPIVIIDAAIEGVVASAFGFNGQKCSACSRAIVDAGIYDIFCDRLQARVAKIKTGDPAQNVYTGPVISERAYRKVLGYIEIGKGEGTVLNGGHAIETPEGGYYIAPTVIADVAPTARIALEEIFGPVLAVIKSNTFDEALAIANNTEYGLTGAIYSSSRRSWTACTRGVPCRQPLLQPQEHRRDGRSPSVRRIQYERDRFKGRGAGLSVAVHSGQEHCREDRSMQHRRREAVRSHGNVPIRTGQIGISDAQFYAVFIWIRLPALAAASARTR